MCEFRYSYLVNLCNLVARYFFKYRYDQNTVKAYSSKASSFTKKCRNGVCNDESDTLSNDLTIDNVEINYR